MSFRNNVRLRVFLLFTIGILVPAQGADLSAQQKKTPAQLWMDALLKAISKDDRGPTIHARNIHQLSVLMYDAWVVYNGKGSLFFLGKSHGDFTCEYDEPFILSEGMDKDSACEVTINYAAYRLLFHRFNLTSSKGRVIDGIDSLFLSFGLDPGYTSSDYHNGSPAALGNYMAEHMIAYGMVDGSNEENDHEPGRYEYVNPQMRPNRPGTQGLKFPNRWQPLKVKEYFHEKGGDSTLFQWNSPLVFNQDVFLSPEWGDVIPFALTEEDMQYRERGGLHFNLYLDPGPPPLLGEGDHSVDPYKWSFILNAIWASHLDPADSVKIDISPGAIGANANLPEKFENYDQFYHLMDGGTRSSGRVLNPVTELPYEPNVVLRGDYTRVIAEYWVDGINTFSPPGHWVHNLGMVRNHPGFEKRWRGKGPEMSDLEWDVKAYFVLGGALHDAAIACWSAKGYYDYIRPISAIRFMAENGQCSNPELPRYHPQGLPLIPGQIELVSGKDPLVGRHKENLDKVKIYCWRGPDHVKNSRTDRAGVGWILAENWWPYQRYSFPTPTFAGYVSGHSTFSVAAAEVLTQITGSPYFPGGIAEFTAKKDEFLLFERGPSQDITLQWATYHDAAAETCLSRIWGGIHPPCDDVPARKMGMQVARKAIIHAESYFD